MIECRAAVLRQIGAARPYGESKPLSIETVRLDPPRHGELVVQVQGAGLCHSDLSNINGWRPPMLPIVIGHEGAGEVVEVGQGVEDLKVGDHVVFQFAASCGRCVHCLEGRPQICSTAAAAAAKGDLMGGGRRIHDADGVAVAHQAGVACFADYAVVDRGSVVRIDPAFPIQSAAIFGCAVMTGVGAVINTARLRAGETVAIVGLGGVGLSALMGARLAGAGSIIGIDIDPAKLDRARTLGADHALDGRNPEVIEQVRDLTAGGVDYALEFVGALPALKTAFGMVRRGGTLIAAGLTNPGAEFGFDPSVLVREEKAIKGSFMGSCVPVRDIPRLIRLEQEGRLGVSALVDRVIGFDELNDGFELLESGRALRQILAPAL